MAWISLTSPSADSLASATPSSPPPMPSPPNPSPSSSPTTSSRPIPRPSASYSTSTTPDKPQSSQCRESQKTVSPDTESSTANRSGLASTGSKLSSRSPTPTTPPPNLGIVGRYILTPAILEALSATQPGALGEIQLTDAIANLLQSQPVYALEFEGNRHDAGNPLGLIQASVSIALTHPHLGPTLRTYLANLDLSTG